MKRTRQLLTVKESSLWASQFLKREISESNISYLIQYGKIKKRLKAEAKTAGERASVYISKQDLKAYYSRRGAKEASWKKRLGQGLSWSLSFDHLREKDTTKHVHRLHPYKGKFIPQLVQYFLDDHTDDLKKEIYFKPGDIVLDPFAGSGTTLVQANEMGIHAIGLDISRFNCLIAEAKLRDYDLPSLKAAAERLKKSMESFEAGLSAAAFEKELLAEMGKFNKKHFPCPGFKQLLEEKKINEREYGLRREKEFLKTYRRLLKKHNLSLDAQEAKTQEAKTQEAETQEAETQEAETQEAESPEKAMPEESFLKKWHLPAIREEIRFALQKIQETKDPGNKKILSVILSRTARSCRATSHFDLGTLKKPQIQTYYCWKHKKICKPLFSIKARLDRYIKDSLRRIEKFSHLKTESFFALIPSDARTADIFREIKKKNRIFRALAERQKIRGIFTSPPYVGQIDYHEQHACAYELFSLLRKDDLEIGPLSKGQGAAAREAYVEGIAKTLRNCRRFLAEDFDIFIVANDKYQLYPEIARRAGMEIANQFKRPVLNRTERDQSPYAECIFRLKQIKNQQKSRAFYRQF